jgi:hypothetical protein
MHLRNGRIEMVCIFEFPEGSLQIVISKIAQARIVMFNRKVMIFFRYGRMAT